MVKVNAVGMACPLPVIETRKALRTENVVETTVDNKIATENLRRIKRRKCRSLCRNRYQD